MLRERWQQRHAANSGARKFAARDVASGPITTRNSEAHTSARAVSGCIRGQEDTVASATLLGSARPAIGADRRIRPDRNPHLAAPANQDVRPLFRRANGRVLVNPCRPCAALVAFALLLGAPTWAFAKPSSSTGRAPTPVGAEPRGHPEARETCPTECPRRRPG